MSNDINYDKSAVLPDKLWQLCELAMADMAKCEVDSGYEVLMSAWHELSVRKPICYVCLAGSVMAQTLKVDKMIECDPSNFPDEICDKLLAINDLRAGNLWNAISLIYADKEVVMPEELMCHTDYVKPTSEWREIMAKRIAWLKENDL